MRFIQVLVGMLVLATGCAESTDDVQKARHMLEEGQNYALAQTLEDDAYRYSYGRIIAHEGNLLAIATYQDDGQVDVYRFTEGAFAKEATIKATLPDARFGSALALSGESVVIAYEASARRVEVWNGDKDAWTMSTVWTPAADDEGRDFGTALFATSTNVFIGAPGRTNGLVPGGRVYVYEGEAGAHQTWTSHMLLANDRAFGKSLGFDGRWLAVGVENRPENHSETVVSGFPEGGILTFERFGPGQWSTPDLLEHSPGDPQPIFGTKLLVSDGSLFVGYAGGNSPAAVYVYKRGNHSWNLAQTIQPPNVSDYFGSAIAVDDDLLAVSTSFADEPVRVYQFAGNRWSLRDAIDDPADVDALSAYGQALAIQGSRLLVSSGGTPRRTIPPSNTPGRVHVFTAGTPPIFEDQHLSTDEDTPLLLESIATDADGDDITFEVSSPGVGNVDTSDSSWWYTPAANWSGLDTLELTAIDATNRSTSATLTVEVRPVNDPPSLRDQKVSCPELPCSLLIPLHPTDYDGDMHLTYDLIDGPEAGEAEVVNDMLRFTLQAHPGLRRLSITLTANDGIASSAPAVIEISMPEAPEDEMPVQETGTTEAEIAQGCATGSTTPVSSHSLDYSASSPAVVAAPSPRAERSPSKLSYCRSLSSVQYPHDVW